MEGEELDRMSEEEGGGLKRDVEKIGGKKGNRREERSRGRKEVEGVR